MRKVAFVAEVSAWCLGLLCCATLLFVRVEAHSAQEASRRFGAQSSPTSSTPGSGQTAAATTTAGDTGHTAGIMGRLEIRSIGLTVPILDDYDASSLRKGVGHIFGTALPGGLGNMALAGHRDTFFRPLRNIKKGMTMSVFTEEGRYDYVVDEMTIVDPEEVSVLNIHNTPEMTLITCYPFDYVGSAPHRFIVRAHLRTIEPATTAAPAGR